MPVADLTTSLAAACTALICAVVLAETRARWVLDDGAGVQKIHGAPVPRIGGVAVAAGIVAGFATQAGTPAAAWLLLACAAPGFAWGLIEDLMKRGVPFVRLVLTALSAMAAFVLLDARITEAGVPGLDTMLAIHAFSFGFTVLGVTGLSHAINVVDGLNGLASVTAAIAAAAIAAVAWMVGDALVFAVACVLAASLAGFLLVNFPNGHVFLGDGGAYLCGLLLGELSVLLLHRNSEVSPWFALLVLAYPVWETVFSMYRRRVRGQRMTDADAQHLHSLLYRRVGSNAKASALLWPLPAGCALFAVSSWDHTTRLQIGALVFVALYGLAYRWARAR